VSPADRYQRAQRPGGSSSGRARRQQAFLGTVSAYALMFLCAAVCVRGDEEIVPVSCPQLMYAPPESGQDSANDCICSGGAVLRNFTAEACTFYKLAREEGCSQSGLQWFPLGIQNSPAACMHAVMANTTGDCKRRDFFLWKDRGGGECYCPAGSPAAVDQCSYGSLQLVLMGASTYTIENLAAGSSCFPTTTDSRCELCPAGKYTNESDSIYNTETCTPCPEGSYSPKVGANSSTDCIPCGAGWYSQSSGGTSSANCVPCAAGKYSTLAVSSGNCLPCPAGTYSESPGENTSGSCILCTAGTYSETPAANSSLLCQLCPAGSYNENPGSNQSAACVPCAAGLFSEIQGANASSLCVPCPAGTYSEVEASNASALCTPCAAGKYSGTVGANNRSTCLACGAGLYSEEVGANSSSTCMLCPQGNYSEIEGAGNRELCLGCPSFSFSLAGSNNLSLCICNQGYSGPNGGPCIACVGGSYKDANGSQACTLCGQGKFSTAVAETLEQTCVTCPSHTFSNEGSNNLTLCKCNKGYTGPDGVECTACREGTYKTVNGSAECSLCARGKYSSGTAQIFEAACQDCPDNTFTPREGSTLVTNCSCNLGYTGPEGVACAACIPGTYKDVNGTADCTHCEHGKYSEEWADIGASTNGSLLLAAAQITAYRRCLEDNLVEGPIQECENFLFPPGCSPCPNHTFSPLGSNNRSMCICNLGYTGPHGQACDACLSGTYKDVNGSQACAFCEGGTYSTIVAATSNDTCSACPANSFSAHGSENITDCLCNAGWAGADGGTCAACAPGTFKAISGTLNCTTACRNETICVHASWMLSVSALVGNFLEQLVFVRNSIQLEAIDRSGKLPGGCMHKKNSPLTWVSSGGAGCVDYVTEGWCENGGYGPNWQVSCICV
jgi:hypothetical protein